MVFRSRPIARLSNWSIALIGLVGAGLTIDSSLPKAGQIGLATVSIGLGAGFSWRGATMYVQVAGGVVTIRGWLTRRSIPVRQVTEVTTYPSIAWIDGDGRNRTAVLWVLAANYHWRIDYRPDLKRLARALGVRLRRSPSLWSVTD
jgi:hypothetical protein